MSGIWGAGDGTRSSVHNRQAFYQAPVFFVILNLPGFYTPYIYFFKFSFCGYDWFWLHVYMCTMCMTGARRIRLPRTEITDGCKPPCQCWEPSPHPLQEQQAPLTTEPSPQPLVFTGTSMCWSDLLPSPDN